MRLSPKMTSCALKKGPTSVGPQEAQNEQVRLAKGHKFMRAEKGLSMTRALVPEAPNPMK